MSCNGCRVLRKGCVGNCTLRPCLDWIESPESQANATLFLAKFYGRAGLINLIRSAPDHLRSEIFRSLLYEACGRIINPVHGSVGLMSSGHWPRCQAAVEAVLRGDPLLRQGIRKRSKRRIESEAKFTITGWDSGQDCKRSGEEEELKSHNSSSSSSSLVKKEIGLDLTLAPNLTSTLILITKIQEKSKPSFGGVANS